MALLVCFFPLFVYILISLAFSKSDSYIVNVITFSLPILKSFFLINSLCNPIIYCYRSKMFRKTCKELLKMKCGNFNERWKLLKEHWCVTWIILEFLILQNLVTSCWNKLPLNLICCVVGFFRGDHSVKTEKRNRLLFSRQISFVCFSFNPGPCYLLYRIIKSVMYCGKKALYWEFNYVPYLISFILV